MIFYNKISFTNFSLAKAKKGRDHPHCRLNCTYLNDTGTRENPAPPSTIPKSAPKLLRPRYDGRSLSCGGGGRGLLENPSRILSRGCRHGRSNERSYLHSTIFFPFFTIFFCSLGIVLPSEPRLAPFALARKECSIMQKCARESFAARALVPTEGVFELILTRGRERVTNANQQSARC